MDIGWSISCMYKTTFFNKNFALKIKWHSCKAMQIDDPICNHTEQRLLHVLFSFWKYAIKSGKLDCNWKSPKTFVTSSLFPHKIKIVACQLLVVPII